MKTALLVFWWIIGGWLAVCVAEAFIAHFGRSDSMAITLIIIVSICIAYAIGEAHGKKADR